MRESMAFAYKRDGRLIGAFVYMLFCREDDSGPWHIKIGITNSPTDRLNALGTALPIPPKLFSFAEFPNKDICRNIERAIHGILAEWRTRGEWFKMDLEDKKVKQAFDEAWKGVFEHYTACGSVPEWTQMSVPEYMSMRQRAAKARYHIQKQRRKRHRQFMTMALAKKNAEKA